MSKTKTLNISKETHEMLKHHSKITGVKLHSLAEIAIRGFLKKASK
jgi:hypothetical protein